MDESGFQIEDPGGPRRRVPRRPLKPLHGAPRSSGETPVATGGRSLGETAAQLPVAPATAVAITSEDLATASTKRLVLQDTSAAPRASGETAAAVLPRSSGQHAVARARQSSGGRAAAGTPEIAAAELDRHASGERGKVPSGEKPAKHGRWDAVVLVVCSAALIAYAFNFDTLENALLRLFGGSGNSVDASSSTMATMLPHVVPYVVLLPALALFYGVAVTLANLIGLRRSSRRGHPGKTRRCQTPLDVFKEQAELQGVSARIAYRGFQLLQPYMHGDEVPTVDLRMETDLGMTPAQVRALRMSLLESTGREADSAARLTPIDTVLSMLISAQRAPKAVSPTAQPPVFVPGDPKMGRR